MREENKQMRILSAIGMILVVAGHLGYSLFDVGGLFPYYSFHVFIFLFVSGYFYREEAEQQLLRYIGKKCKALLLPYFIWNLVYGILAVLLHRTGFSIGGELTLWNLFIEPFVSGHQVLAPFDGGHQFMYQFPAWFVPALFLIEVLNVLGRKVLSFLHLKKEWLIFAVSLLLGIATVALAKGGHVWGYYKFPGRLLFMMPGFQLGRIYKEKLENRVNKISDGRYFFVVVGVQLLTTICCRGLAFSTVWVTGFANAAFIPYLTVVTGIAFWLRISDWISRIPSACSWFMEIGRHTYAIMMHHVFWFFVVNSICYLLSRTTVWCAEFDTAQFFSDINYVYAIGGSDVGKWFYLALGTGMPLLLANGTQYIVGKKISRK